MNEPICFIVSGEPRPKQSFKVSKNGGYTPKRVKQWQEHVAWRAREAMAGRQPLEGAVSIRFIFALSDRRRVDLDNLSKGTLDALRHIVIEDDCQVQNLHLVKHVLPNPGVLVQIFPGDKLPPLDTPVEKGA